MTAYADLHRLPENARIKLIAHRVVGDHAGISAVTLGQVVVGDGFDDVVVVGLSVADLAESRKVQHGQALCVVGGQGPAAAPILGAAARSSSRRKLSSQGNLMPERSSWLTTALTPLQTAWENPCEKLHSVQLYSCVQLHTVQFNG